MALRTISYRTVAGPGPIQRAVIDDAALPQEITGLTNDVEIEVDTGRGVWVSGTPTGPASYFDPFDGTGAVSGYTRRVGATGTISRESGVLRMTTLSGTALWSADDFDAPGDLIATLIYKGASGSGGPSAVVNVGFRDVVTGFMYDIRTNAGSASTTYDLARRAPGGTSTALTTFTSRPVLAINDALSLRRQETSATTVLVSAYHNGALIGTFSDTNADRLRNNVQPLCGGINNSSTRMIDIDNLRMEVAA